MDFAELLSPPVGEGGSAGSRGGGGNVEIAAPKAEEVGLLGGGPGGSGGRGCGRCGVVDCNGRIAFATTATARSSSCILSSFRTQSSARRFTSSDLSCSWCRNDSISSAPVAPTPGGASKRVQLGPFSSKRTQCKYKPK